MAGWAVVTRKEINTSLKLLKKHVDSKEKRDKILSRTEVSSHGKAWHCVRMVTRLSFIRDSVVLFPFSFMTHTRDDP